MQLGVVTVLTAIAFVAGCATTDYDRRATTVYLPRDRVTYFRSDHLTGADYTVLRPDGTWTKIAQEHMGVWPGDGGTWTQDNSGLLTMVSTGCYATISAPPLEIYVGPFANAICLPTLRAQLVRVLDTNSISRFRITDKDAMPVFHASDGEHGLQVDMIEIREWEDAVATRAQIGRLISAIDRFLENPPAANESALPKTYKDRTFLMWVRRTLGHGHTLAEICRDIDQVNPGDTIPYHNFMVSEEQFEKGVGKSYSFKFHPEMNKITGAD